MNTLLHEASKIFIKATIALNGSFAPLAGALVGAFASAAVNGGQYDPYITGVSAVGGAGIGAALTCCGVSLLMSDRYNEHEQDNLDKARFWPGSEGPSG